MQVSLLLFLYTQHTHNLRLRVHTLLRACEKCPRRAIMLRPLSDARILVKPASQAAGSTQVGGADKPVVLVGLAWRAELKRIIAVTRSARIAKSQR